MPKCGLRIFQRSMELHIGADCPSKNLEFDETSRDLEFVRNRVDATLHEICRFEGYLLSLARPFALRCKHESVGSGVLADAAPVLDVWTHEIRNRNQRPAVTCFNFVRLHSSFE